MLTAISPLLETAPASLDLHLLQTLVAGAPDGVLVCDARAPDWPVLYANAAMQQLTGYSVEELQGRNPRFLQAHDHDQEGLTRIRMALRDGTGCHAILRNYRRDSTMFWNEVTLLPLKNANGELTHYASFHRDGSERLRAETRAEARDPSLSTQTMLAYLRDDKLTGLLRRPYFEELVKRDWALAQRESRRIAVFIFDLDFYAQYREVFGRLGADQSFRRIARVVSGCFRRASDLCGRFDEDQIAALSTGIDLPQAARLAETVLARIRDLAIHHPRSSVSRFLTASAGVVSWIPPNDVAPTRMYNAALQALRDAKQLGRNRLISRECE